MYDINISLYNRIYNSIINTELDKNVLNYLDYNDFFNLSKIWIKKQGFSIITIFDPNKENIEIIIKNNKNIIFNNCDIDEKKALFNVLNQLCEFIQL